MNRRYSARASGCEGIIGTLSSRLDSRISRGAPAACRIPAAPALNSDDYQTRYDQAGSCELGYKLPTFEILFKPVRSQPCEQVSSDEDDCIADSRNGVDNSWMRQADCVEDQEGSYAG